MEKFPLPFSDVREVFNIPKALRPRFQQETGTLFIY